MPTMPAAVDYLNPRLWAGIVQKAQYPTVKIGYNYLPEREVAADRIIWEFFSQSSRLAPFVALDAESPRMLPRPPSQMAWADIVFIREKVAYTESDMRWLRAPGSPPIAILQDAVGAMQQQQAQRIARDLADLKEHVANTIEWMQINSLLGSLTVSANTGPMNIESPINFTITYPVVTKTASPLWSDTANADPIKDLTDWTFNLNYTVNRMIAPPEAILNVARNAKVLRYLGYWAGQAGGTLPGEMSVTRARQFIAEEFGIQVTEYRSVYTERRVDANGLALPDSITRYLPSDKIILLPSVDPGYTATGRAIQSDPPWQSGIFNWMSDPAQTGRKDPWLFEHGVGYYGVPILEQPEQVIVATVA